MGLETLAKRRYVIAALGTLLPVLLTGIGLLSGSINLSEKVGVHWSGARGADEYALTGVVIIGAAIISLLAAAATMAMVSLTRSRARGNNGVAVAAAASAFAQFEAFLMIVTSGLTQYNGSAVAAAGSVIALAIGLVWLFTVRACLSIGVGTPRSETTERSGGGARMAWLQELQRPMYRVGGALVISIGAAVASLGLLIRVPEFAVMTGVSLLLGCAQLFVSRVNIVANESAILIRGRLGIPLHVIPWQSVMAVSAQRRTGTEVSDWSAEATRPGLGTGRDTILIEEADGHRITLHVPEASQVAREIQKMRAHSVSTRVQPCTSTKTMTSEEDR